MEGIYKAVEAKFATDLGEYGVQQLYAAPDAPTKRLAVESVKMDGAPRRWVSQGSFTDAGNDPVYGDPRERIDFTVMVDKAKMDLRETTESSVRKAVLAEMKKQFETVKLTDGTTLASKMDFSGETPEAKKPVETQLADLKVKVEKGLAQAGDAVPQPVKDLLLHAKTFDTKDSSVFGWSSKPDVFESHVQTTLAINDKNSGEKSNTAVVMDNINARKDEIIEGIRQSALELHAKNGADAAEMERYKTDLAKLDLQVNMSGSSLTVQLGNKLDKAPAENEFVKVGKTELSKLSADVLDRIVGDNLLFTGKGAGEVAHMIAGDTDVKRLLTEFKDKAPALEEAANSDVLKDGGRWSGMIRVGGSPADDDKGQPQPIQPSITINTSFSEGEQKNQIHVGINLPKDVSHKQVMMALAGIQIADQKATTKLDEGRAASANDKQAQLAG